MSVSTYLLHHRHEPDECGVAFAAFTGHASPLRHRATVASCLADGHGVWWPVDAPTAEDAIGLLPFFIVQRSSAVEVRKITIP